MMVDLLTDAGNGNFAQVLIDPLRIARIEPNVRSPSAFNAARGCLLTMDDGHVVFTYTSEATIVRAMIRAASAPAPGEAA